MQCPQGHPVLDGDPFCSTCGLPVAPVPPARRCAASGHVMQPEDDFCGQCGAHAARILVPAAAGSRPGSCPAGHPVLTGQAFCGHCGQAVSPPRLPLAEEVKADVPNIARPLAAHGRWRQRGPVFLLAVGLAVAILAVVGLVRVTSSPSGGATGTGTSSPSGGAKEDRPSGCGLPYVLTSGAETQSCATPSAFLSQPGVLVLAARNCPALAAGKPLAPIPRPDLADQSIASPDDKKSGLFTQQDAAGSVIYQREQVELAPGGQAIIAALGSASGGMIIVSHYFNDHRPNLDVDLHISCDIGDTEQSFTEAQMVAASPVLVHGEALLDNRSVLVEVGGDWASTVRRVAAYIGNAAMRHEYSARECGHGLVDETAQWPLTSGKEESLILYGNGSRVVGWGLTGLVSARGLKAESGLGIGATIAAVQATYPDAKRMNPDSDRAVFKDSVRQMEVLTYQQSVNEIDSGLNCY